MCSSYRRPLHKAADRDEPKSPGVVLRALTFLAFDLVFFAGRQQPGELSFGARHQKNICLVGREGREGARLSWAQLGRDGVLHDEPSECGPAHLPAMLLDRHSSP